uniref:Uncharacterized protein n=1 Tax=Anguilla anguilla TaxID=7936 RepID=A0A0E9RT29_ANGAN
MIKPVPQHLPVILFPRCSHRNENH